MKQENKELLLKDLCSRLPYGVVVELDEKFGFNKGTHTLVKELLDSYSVEGIKPYLRPMSSMTEEENKEICQFMKDYNLLPGPDRAGVFCGEIVDWLNAHHFDYRGLIEKGFAIEVTKENNPYENNNQKTI